MLFRSAQPVVTVVASILLPRLLTWSTADLASVGQSLGLMDGSGSTFATVGLDAAGHVDVIPLLGTTSRDATGIEVNASSGDVSRGSSLIPFAGLEQWHVVATAPPIVVSVPWPTLAALVVLLLLLIVGTWWMGRQILAPAAALESRRAHFENLYESAREAALIDSLTGLGNHRAFQEAVTRIAERARRYNRPMGLLLLDIDEGKRETGQAATQQCV